MDGSRFARSTHRLSTRLRLILTILRPHYVSIAGRLVRVAVCRATLHRFLQEQHNLEGEWFQAGKEVVQFTINKVSNAKRGKSDLATLLPWLRRYKDWLTDRVRINKYKGAFLWDVQLTGADR